MKSAQTPAPPDPTNTSNAQLGYNTQAARAQMGMNQTNQVTPYGSLTYSQNGVNPDGTPRYQATTSLSTGQQHLVDKQAELGNTFANLAQSQASQLGGVLGQPVNLTNDAVEGRLMELGRSRLDPMLQRQWQAQEADLLNRGIGMDSEAYDRERTRFDERQNDAYNQLLLTGRGQSVNEILGARNQSIQELQALLGGAQPVMPSFQNTPQVSIASPDYASAVNSNYQGQLQAANAKNQANSAMLGGLFGLGGTALGGWARGGFTMPKFG